ncbi:hypothetical protein Tco_0892644 [Tanacetum coccineum]|uniref:Uncharacterized protein n=1 Tax=Tanacetum coccineum TaxID=301880 RepID=A0ABQ5C9G5_9ASTR
MSEATIASLKVGQEKCVLEAKVYRKWTSKSIPQMTQLAFCCILIDKENNAVQANMDLNNLDYFDSLLKPRTAYRISNFIWKESEFAEHHFKFTTYNQLQSKVPYRDEDSKLIYPILTGCIRSISDVIPFGNANTGKKYRRKVDIESLE